MTRSPLRMFLFGAFLQAQLLFAFSEIRIEFPHATCEDPEATLRLEQGVGTPAGPELPAPLPQPLTLPRPPVGTRLVFKSVRCFVPVLLVDEGTADRLSARVDPRASLTFQLEATRFQQLRWAYADAFRWGKSPFPQEGLCESEGRQVRCAVPAREIAVRIAGREGAPHYRFGLKPEGGKTLALERLPMRKGGSLAGWIEPPSGERLPSRLEVAALLEANRLQEPGSNARRPVPVPPQERIHGVILPNGFFQVVGLRAQVYDVEVSGGSRQVGWVSDVWVPRNGELLLESAIPLSWKHRLGVELEPPSDPDGFPWSVELHRRLGVKEDPGSRWLEPVDRKEADALGQAMFEDLTPGAYWVTVRSRQKEPVFDQPVELIEKTLEQWVSLKMKLVQVSGRLRCRGEPFQGVAQLSWGKNWTQFSRRVELDPEGRFSTWVERGVGRLGVLVEQADGFSTSPLLYSGKIPANGSIEVDVDFPGASVLGRVVGRDGHPRSGARVELVRSQFLDPSATREEYAAAVTDSNGSFEVPCVRQGRWEISASDRRNSEHSRPTVLELHAGKEVSGLELQLEAFVLMAFELRRGNVPVEGDGVCFPSGRELLGGGYGGGTYEPGRGWVEVPEGELTCIFWDGVTMTFRRLEAKRDTSVPHRVFLPEREATATLLLRWPNPENLDGPTSRRWLQRDGVRLPLFSVSRFDDLAGRIQRVEGLEAGVYQLCGWHSGCEPLVLAPGATVTVEGFEILPETTASR